MIINVYVYKNIKVGNYSNLMCSVLDKKSFAESVARAVKLGQVPYPDEMQLYYVCQYDDARLQLVTSTGDGSPEFLLDLATVPVLRKAPDGKESA